MLLGHKEIDSVTFERGKPHRVDRTQKPIAGEMCQALNDHWGYAQDDCNFKSVKELIENLVDCRKFNCNFLLNTGLKGNGSVNAIDKALLGEIGKWMKANKSFIYGAKTCDAKCEGAFLLQKGASLYAVIKDVPMSADPNVANATDGRHIKLDPSLRIRKASWLDSGDNIPIQNNSFAVQPFPYGTSLSVRVALLETE